MAKSDSLIIKNVKASRYEAIKDAKESILNAIEKIHIANNTSWGIRESKRAGKAIKILDKIIKVLEKNDADCIGPGDR